MSKINVLTWEQETGTAATLMATGDTVTVPSGAEIDIASGATLDVNGTLDVTGATVTGLSAGKVLQIVQTVDTTNRSTTSGTLTGSGCQVAITPASTSNKVLLIASGVTGCDESNRKIQYISLLRGATDLTPAGTNAILNYILTGQTSNNEFMADIFTMHYLDSPSTTSATTYEISIAVETGTIYLGRRGWATTLDAPTVFTAMEIEG